MFAKKAGRFVNILIVLTIVAGGLYFLNRHESSAKQQITDDAYVSADWTALSTQVSGIVEKVLIQENSQVRSGDLLATIDDRDFQIAVDAAQAKLASIQASIASRQARLEQQNGVIDQARASVAAVEAGLQLARENESRYRNLAADGSGTVQALQQAQAKLSIELAELEKSRAGLDLAQQQVQVLRAELDKDIADLAQAQAALDSAELKLTYTQIVAPIDGSIGQNSLRVGAFVSSGKPVLAIVPLSEVYVLANFRETQLFRVKVGQTVELEVDAMPGVVLNGTVDSLGPASGVSYSPIAAHNATGNFTKIVQRLPVRISINPNQSFAHNLRVGMSVKSRIMIDN